jgi:hypothetical protein
VLKNGKEAREKQKKSCPRRAAQTNRDAELEPWIKMRSRFNKIQSLNHHYKESQKQKHWLAAVIISP